MIQSLYSLSDEGCENGAFLVFGDPSVDPGCKYYSDIVRRNPVSDQPPNAKINNLTCSRLPRRIGNYDQNTVAWRDGLFHGGRVDRTVKLLADIGVRKRPMIFFMHEDKKSRPVIFKRYRGLAVPEIDICRNRCQLPFEVVLLALENLAGSKQFTPV